MTPSRDDLRALVRHLEGAIEAERARLARTLHDEMAQGVTALRFSLERLADGLCDGGAPAGLAGEARAAVDRLDDLMRSVRRIMSDLRPAVLDQVGLRAALEWRLREFERRTGIAVDVDVHGEPPVSGDQATRVYRIVSDELARLERAGTAALVRLALHRRETRCDVELTAHDYVAAPETPDHAVLVLQFHERVRELGGFGSIEHHAAARVVTVGVPLVIEGGRA